MKLYEFVDKLYAMGDMEAPKTVRSKKTLNESVSSSRYEIRGYDSVDGSIDTKELLVKDRETKQVYHYIDLLKLVRRFSKQNGFEIDEQQVSEIIRKLVKELTQPDAEDIRDIIALFLMQEDDLDEDLNDIISVTVDFNSDEDEYEVINYIKQKYNIDVVDYDPTDYIENATLRGTKSNLIKYLATEYQGYDSEEEGIDWVKDFYPELFDESLTEDDIDEGILGGLAGAAIGGLAGNSLGHPILGAIGGGLAGNAIQNALNDDLDEESEGEETLTEAANPENAEVNAVLRKWANSDRNRISKHDQKVLDDAGIKLKTDRYNAPHKYAVHKDNESDILDLHRMDKHHIKNTHPDHDLANDLATTGRHWSNRDRYNKNKDPNFPWRDDAYRSETPEESKALRPYSDEYKRQKRAADYGWYLREEGLNEAKDLSTVKGSMTQILQDNREKIDACSSAQEVHDVVAGLLAEADLDTPATKRLLMTLKKQKSLVGALQAVYNSILKGSDLGVIKEDCSTEIKEAMELAEAKQKIIGKFYTMMEEFMIDADDQVEYLLDFIADEDLQRLMDEFLEYME